MLVDRTAAAPVVFVLLLLSCDPFSTACRHVPAQGVKDSL
jgi:hypothetical protein